MTALLAMSKDPKAVLADAEKAMSMPIGVASPLWAMFAGAATAGVAFWWLTRWRGVTNLEAVLTTAATQPAAAPLPMVEPEPLAPEIVEAVAEVIEPAVESAVETAPEAVAEALAPARPARVRTGRAAADPDA